MGNKLKTIENHERTWDILLEIQEDSRKSRRLKLSWLTIAVVLLIILASIWGLLKPYAPAKEYPPLYNEAAKIDHYYQAETRDLNRYVTLEDSGFGTPLFVSGTIAGTAILPQENSQYDRLCLSIQQEDGLIWYVDMGLHAAYDETALALSNGDQLTAVGFYKGMLGENNIYPTISLDYLAEKQVTKYKYTSPQTFMSRAKLADQAVNAVYHDVEAGLYKDQIVCMEGRITWCEQNVSQVVAFELTQTAEGEEVSDLIYLTKDNGGELIEKYAGKTVKIYAYVDQLNMLDICLVHR